MFSGKSAAENPERRKRAEELVRRMGYEFYVKTAEVVRSATGTIRIRVFVENRGVAPFYYNWPVEFGLLDDSGACVRTVRTRNTVLELLPGEPCRKWTARIPLRGLPKANYILALRVPNPMPGGRPIRFANTTQDAHADGWLSLMSISW